MEYPKIDTLFERNEKFIVDPSKIKSPVIATISEWDVTEKIDGTNMRATLAEGTSFVKIDGRTDKASIPGDLLKYMVNTFDAAKIHAMMDASGPGWGSVVLYGEGYGAGIQKGGFYRADKAFRLFDVLVGGKWWLDWSAITDVATKLEIKTAPYLGRWTLNEIVTAVQEGVPSTVAAEESGQAAIAEGVVARPIETLFNKKGQRLIIKLKTKDFGK
jgi:hypothetical protein